MAEHAASSVPRLSTPAFDASMEAGADWRDSSLLANASLSIRGSPRKRCRCLCRPVLLILVGIVASVCVGYYLTTWFGVSTQKWLGSNHNPSNAPDCNQQQSCFRYDSVYVFGRPSYPSEPKTFAFYVNDSFAQYFYVDYAASLIAICVIPYPPPASGGWFARASWQIYQYDKMIYRVYGKLGSVLNVLSCTSLDSSNNANPIMSTNYFRISDVLRVVSQYTNIHGIYDFMQSHWDIDGFHDEMMQILDTNCSLALPPPTLAFDGVRIQNFRQQCRRLDRDPGPSGTRRMWCDNLLEME